MTYLDFGTWMRERFLYKVQKISIDAGFSCPNRDGKLSKGGCTFCNNESFNPSYCSPKESITEQIERGKEFFSKKYPDMKYLAYFQAYTNTYAPLAELQCMYEEALSVKDVVGIVTEFYRKGRKTPDLASGKKWRYYSKIWLLLTPLRRYLLYAHRNIWLKIFPPQINKYEK